LVYIHFQYMCKYVCERNTVSKKGCDISTNRTDVIIVHLCTLGTNSCPFFFKRKEVVVFFHFSISAKHTHLPMIFL
jgi:hypothetical protein